MVDYPINQMIFQGIEGDLRSFDKVSDHKLLKLVGDP